MRICSYFVWSVSLRLRCPRWLEVWPRRPLSTLQVDRTLSFRPSRSSCSWRGGTLLETAGDLGGMPSIPQWVLAAHFQGWPDYRSPSPLHPPAPRMARAFYTDWVRLFDIVEQPVNASSAFSTPLVRYVYTIFSRRSKRSYLPVVAIDTTVHDSSPWSIFITPFFYHLAAPREWLYFTDLGGAMISVGCGSCNTNNRMNPSCAFGIPRKNRTRASFVYKFPCIPKMRRSSNAVSI